MSIKETHVEVTLRGKSIPYYEQLGYAIPRRKTRDGHCVPRGLEYL